MGKTEDHLVATLRKYLIEHPDEADQSANPRRLSSAVFQCMFASLSLTVQRLPFIAAVRRLAQRNKALDFRPNASLMSSGAT